MLLSLFLGMIQIQILLFLSYSTNTHSFTLRSSAPTTFNKILNFVDELECVRCERHISQNIVGLVFIFITVS